jgi:hypothetical protein
MFSAQPDGGLEGEVRLVLFLVGDSLEISAPYPGLAARGRAPLDPVNNRAGGSCRARGACSVHTLAAGIDLIPLFSIVEKSIAYVEPDEAKSEDRSRLLGPVGDLRPRKSRRALGLLEAKSGAGAFPAETHARKRKYLRRDGTGDGSSALMRRDGLHNDPLSSFVPELKPRFGGVFLSWSRGEPGPPASSRVSGVEGKGSLQSAVLGHGRGVRLALLTARSEARPRNVVFGRPAILAGLTDPGLLANRLGHGLRRSEPLSVPQGPYRRPVAEPGAREPRSGGVAAPNFKSLTILVWHDSLPKFFLVSRPSQPPCDTRHEEAPAAFAGASN